MIKLDGSGIAKSMISGSPENRSNFGHQIWSKNGHILDHFAWGLCPLDQMHARNLDLPGMSVGPFGPPNGVHGPGAPGDSTQSDMVSIWGLRA